jgi:hypothetical protein
VFQSVFMIFSTRIPYYKEGHVDEVKIIKSSDSKSFSKLSQTKTPSQTLSGPTGQYLSLPEKASNTHREF